MAEPVSPGEGSGGPAESGGLAEERFLSALAGWAAGQRVAGAAAGRSRFRALTDAAAGSATLVGILVDLAERRAEVAVTCSGAAPASSPGPATGETRATGTVIGVGRDFIVMEQNNGRPVIIRTASLTSVWPTAPLPGPAAPGGDRPAPLALSLEAVLSELAAEIAPVAVGTGSSRLDGELLAVGEDVMTLRCGGSARRVVHLPMAGVHWCELR